MSACSDNQSTILPFPSSPHWAPTTTTLAISYGFPASQWFQHASPETNCLPFRIMPFGMVQVEPCHRLFLRFGHDLFGKPVSTFPDHALTCPAKITAGG